MLCLPPIPWPGGTNTKCELQSIQLGEGDEVRRPVGGIQERGKPGKRGETFQNFVRKSEECLKTLKQIVLLG